MALTYTVAGLKAELDALETARKARNWATAWDEFVDYASVYAALPEGAINGASVKFPDPEALRRSLIAAQEAVSRNTRDRVLHTRTNYAQR